MKNSNGNSDFDIDEIISKLLEAKTYNNIITKLIKI